MSLPQELIDLIHEVNKTHPIAEEAVPVAVERVRNSSLYTSEVREELINLAIRELIYANRCTANRTLKREVLSSDPKLKPLTHSVMSAASSFYDLYVGGTRLGSILGKQLPTLAADERARSEGHLNNAMLFDALSARKIPAEGKVEDYISETDLRKLYNRVIRAKRKQAV
jgi:hypothetical protein